MEINVFQEYLKSDKLDECNDLLQYWQKEKSEILKELALSYLITSPSSINAERLFSSCDNFYTKKRVCLSLEKLEKLVFIKKNYGLLN